MKMKTADFGASTRSLGDPFNQFVAKPIPGESGLKDDRQDGDHGHEGVQRAARPALQTPAHGCSPCPTTSIFRRLRVSSSHCAERSLIACWTSTSRIVSSTSSSGGTDSFLAFSCGANWSL